MSITKRDSERSFSFTIRFAKSESDDSWTEYVTAFDTLDQSRSIGPCRIYDPFNGCSNAGGAGAGEVLARYLMLTNSPRPNGAPFT